MKKNWQKWLGGFLFGSPIIAGLTWALVNGYWMELLQLLGILVVGGIMATGLLLFGGLE